MLIPFSLFDKLFSFLISFPTAKSHPENVKNFFPCYPIVMLSEFEEYSLNLTFMETHTRVFRSAPPSQNKDYITWLDKVQLKGKIQWDKLGIFDIIKISRTDHRYNPDMLLALIFFWRGLTNTFPWRIPTPTLFNVAAITRLKPKVETFTPIIEIENEFVFEHFSLKNYITDHHKKNTAEVSN